MRDQKLEEVLESLGLNLYIYRIYRRRSMEDAATAVEISPAMLKRIEDGKHPRCRVSTVYFLAKYYKTSPQAVWDTF